MDSVSWSSAGLSSPWTPVIEDSVLIVQTQEEPHADGLQPEDHKEEPDRREQQLTHHPETCGGEQSQHHHHWLSSSSIIIIIHHHHHHWLLSSSSSSLIIIIIIITKVQIYMKKPKIWKKSKLLQTYKVQILIWKS